jgi:hypothetical protein
MIIHIYPILTCIYPLCTCIYPPALASARSTLASIQFFVAVGSLEFGPAVGTFWKSICAWQRF